ncbi:MAG: hypothetical protein R3F61_14320 [Myxococcota bacterium]
MRYVGVHVSGPVLPPVVGAMAGVMGEIRPPAYVLDNFECDLENDAESPDATWSWTRTAVGFDVQLRSEDTASARREAWSLFLRYSYRRLACFGDEGSWCWFVCYSDRGAAVFFRIEWSVD